MPINTNFPRRFLCCLLPLPIQCMHKPKRELVNIFVGDTAHLRVSGKSVCHFLQDFLTGGSGTGFEKEWIFTTESQRLRAAQVSAVLPSWSAMFGSRRSSASSSVTTEACPLMSGKDEEYNGAMQAF